MLLSYEILGGEALGKYSKQLKDIESGKQNNENYNRNSKARNIEEVLRGFSFGFLH